MTMLKKLFSCVITMTLVVSPIAHAVPSNHGTLERHENTRNRVFRKNPVNQGDWVYIEPYGYCTIGYVDKVNHRAYTAAHCAPLMETGSRINVIEPFVNEMIGELFVRTQTYNAHGKQWRSLKSDATYIQLYPEVPIGENVYSGDDRIMPDEVEAGDEICIYSLRLNKTTCNPAFSTFGPVIKMNAPRYNIDPPISVEGDSGGPGWIPGKGFVGVISSHGGSTLWLTSIDANDCMSDEPVDQLQSEGFEPQVCEPGKEYSDQSPYNSHRFDTRFKPLRRGFLNGVPSNGGDHSSAPADSAPMIVGAILTLLTLIAGLLSYLPNIQKIIEKFV